MKVGGNGNKTPFLLVNDLPLVGVIKASSIRYAGHLARMG